MQMNREQTLENKVFNFFIALQVKMLFLLNVPLHEDIKVCVCSLHLRELKSQMFMHLAF